MSITGHKLDINSQYHTRFKAGSGDCWCELRRLETVGACELRRLETGDGARRRLVTKNMQKIHKVEKMKSSVQPQVHNS